MVNTIYTILLVPSGFGDARLCASDSCQLDIK
jgi:hypothetical protein